MMSFTLYNVAVLILFYVCELYADENEFRLMNYLMSGYEKSVRPSQHASNSLNVTFGVALTQIIDVDERNQILTTNCWLNQIWIDYNLKWNESDFGGIQFIRIPVEKIWKPDIILYNNADSQYQMAVLSTNVIVKSDGNVTWLSSAILKSSCGIDVEYFPFDEQRCNLKFASWTYDGRQLELLIQTETGDLSNYVKNGEWDLIDVNVHRNVLYYSCCQGPYPDVTYEMVLRRRPLFYAFNLILPCILINGIALMSFYMPSDSGEKVTLGITTLLSITVFLMVIGESMPPTSEKLPLIGIYYGVTITLVTLATGLSVVTLNIHHRGMRGRQVPHLVKKIVLNFLVKLLFIKLQKEPNNKIVSSTPIFKISNGTLDRQVRLKCDPNIGLQLSTNQQQGDNQLGPKYSSLFEYNVTRVLDRLHRTIDSNDFRLAERDRNDVIRTEWQQVALVLDRFLLVVFIIATIISTWCILYMSPHTKLL